MKYVLSKRAESDLIAIYLMGVEQFGFAQAEAYQDEIDQKITLIAEAPKIARLRTEITPPVRIHPVGVHIIVYLIEDDIRVRILRIRHGRENWTATPL